MCPGQDLNLHALRRYHLKVVRLPISPPGRREEIISTRLSVSMGQTTRSISVKLVAEKNEAN